MKKLILAIIFFGMVKFAYPAELLVQAKPHYMDSFTQSDVDKMTVSEKQSYEARGQIGDIIVVRPDDWTWGKEESLPNYVVVKVPQMTEEKAKKYEESLTKKVTEINSKPEIKIVRLKKYALPQAIITAIKTNSISLTETAVTTKIITKIGLTTEISPPVKVDLISSLRKKIPQKIELIKRFFLPHAYAATQLLKTVMPSGGDYTSLEACMNANEQNLVTADKYFDVKIDGTWSSADTTACVIHLYTTDATRYINIYTTTAARHLGIFPTAYYRIQTSTDYDSSITISSQFVTFTGVAGKNTGSTDTHWNRVINIGTNNVTIDKCIAISKGHSFACADDMTGIIFKNSIGISTGSNSGFASYGAWNNPTGQVIYNCIGVALGSGAGIQGVSYNITVKNSYAYSASGTAYSQTILTTSASDDTSGTLDNIPYDTSTFTNVTAGSENFHLVAGSALIDVGTDLSATFTDDIDGVTRSGTWDIGADEYVAAGGARQRMFTVN